VVSTLGSRLTGMLASESSVGDLRAYFAEPDQHGRSVTFSGRNFERLGGGGDDPSVANRFTASDLIAVEMLSVNVPAETSFQVLEGTLGNELAALLTAIPTDISMSDPRAAELLADDSAASRVWTMLREQPGVGWVIAGKLMARKRPHLIPVYDDVVRCAVGNPPSWWSGLHEALQKDRGLVTSIDWVRGQADVPAGVSDLRVLDVIIWMHHKDAHRAGNCEDSVS